MKTTIPTTEELIETSGYDWGHQEKEDRLKQMLIKFATLHVQACKEEIAKQAKIVSVTNGDGWSGTDNHGWKSEGEYKKIDRNSILNAYPTDKIK